MPINLISTQRSIFDFPYYQSSFHHHHHLRRAHVTTLCTGRRAVPFISTRLLAAVHCQFLALQHCTPHISNMVHFHQLFIHFTGTKSSSIQAHLCGSFFIFIKNTHHNTSIGNILGPIWHKAFGCRFPVWFTTGSQVFLGCPRLFSPETFHKELGPGQGVNWFFPWLILTVFHTQPNGAPFFLVVWVYLGFG